MDQKSRTRPPRAARLSPQDRRAQLLACAITAFADSGVSRAGHADVARLAGVSVPTVFVYFPTREALVDAVLREVGRFIVDEVLTPVQSHAGEVPALLIETAAAFTEFVGTQPDYARVWLDWSTAFRDDVWPQYLQFQDRVVEVIKATVLRGKHDGSLARRLDADDATRLIVGSAHMLAQMKFMGRETAQVVRFIQTLVDGFRAQDATPRRRAAAAGRQR